jgi:SPRY domain-containing protein
MLFNKLIPTGDDEFYVKTINYSCRFNDNDSAHFSRTPSSAGDLRTFVMFSGWVKRCNLGIICPIVYVDGAANDDILEFNTSDQLTLTLAGVERRRSTQLFRDPTSWFHLYVAIDSTQAAAADRITIEINGEEITAFGVETDPAQDDQFNFNNTVAHYIGRRATSYADMYLAEVFVVDGSVPAVSTFTQSKYNICIPKSVFLTYGTNGAHLDFESAAALGNDVSGNNNDWTSSGLTSDDQVDDSPTNNYATLNSVDKGTGAVLANGNLQLINPALQRMVRATFLLPSAGKWYWEYTAGSASGGMVGIAKALADPDVWLGNDAYGYAYNKNALKYNNGSSSAYGASYTTNDVIGVLWDADNGELTFYKNNASQGVAWTGLTGEYFPAIGELSQTGIINFGQLGFTYTPPTGALALCSASIDDPEIEDCSNGVVTVTDTGANIPATLATARANYGSYIDIFRNLDAAESWDIIFSDDPANSIHFDTDAAKGAKQSLVAGNNYLGASLRVGATYGCYAAEISHTNGSETNQAHGLGSADLAIAKITNVIGDWWMSHPELTASYNILINGTAAETATEYVEVDNTNVTIKSAAPTGTYRVIVFREIEGFSKFGVHGGNAAADGPCSHSGLRPALSLIKDADGAVNWLLFNKDRLGYNVDNNELHPNTNDAEGTTDMVDITSNGKKIRTTNAEINTSAHNYIFLDWAEQPGKWANAR